MLNYQRVVITSQYYSPPWRARPLKEISWSCLQIKDIHRLLETLSQGVRAVLLAHEAPLVVFFHSQESTTQLYQISLDSLRWRAPCHTIYTWKILQVSILGGPSVLNKGQTYWDCSCCILTTMEEYERFRLNISIADCIYYFILFSIDSLRFH